MKLADKIALTTIIIASVMLIAAMRLAIRLGGV